MYSLIFLESDFLLLFWIKSEFLPHFTRKEATSFENSVEAQFAVYRIQRADNLQLRHARLVSTKMHGGQQPAMRASTPVILCVEDPQALKQRGYFAERHFEAAESALPRGTFIVIALRRTGAQQVASGGAGSDEIALGQHPQT